MSSYLCHSVCFLPRLCFDPAPNLITFYTFETLERKKQNSTLTKTLKGLSNLSETVKIVIVSLALADAAKKCGKRWWTNTIEVQPGTQEKVFFFVRLMETQLLSRMLLPLLLNVCHLV